MKLKQVEVEFPALICKIRDEKNTRLKWLVQLLLDIDESSPFPIKYLAEDIGQYAWGLVGHDDTHQILEREGYTKEHLLEIKKEVRSIVKAEIIARLKSRATKTKLVWRSENKPYFTKGIPTEAFRS